MVKVTLGEIGKFERMKKNTIYKKGTILFPVSAAKTRNVEFLNEDSKVGDENVIYIVDSKYNDRYIYEVINMVYSRWKEKHIQNINIPAQELKGILINIHEKREEQDEIAQKCIGMDELITNEEKIVEKTKSVKKTLLSKMFI